MGSQPTKPSYEEAVPEPWCSLVYKESCEDAPAPTMQFNTALQPEASLSMAEMVRLAASPCRQSMLYLMNQYLTNPEVPMALEQVCKGIQELPPAYKQTNPWKSSSGAELVYKMARLLAQMVYETAPDPHIYCSIKPYCQEECQFTILLERLILPPVLSLYAPPQ